MSEISGERARIDGITGEILRVERVEHEPFNTSFVPLNKNRREGEEEGKNVSTISLFIVSRIMGWSRYYLQPVGCVGESELFQLICFWMDCNCKVNHSDVIKAETNQPGGRNINTH